MNNSVQKHTEDKAPDEVSDNGDVIWQCQFLNMFTELQTTVKGIQIKLDTLMPIIKK